MLENVPITFLLVESTSVILKNKPLVVPGAFPIPVTVKFLAPARVVVLDTPMYLPMSEVAAAAVVHNRSDIKELC